MSERTDDEKQEALNTEALRTAKDLVSCIEQGDLSKASELIRELSRVREESLFVQIGRLTRELHESLKSFQEDSKFCNITEVDLPDARTRLNFVIEKTDQAANRTMDNIDKTIPISDSLSKEAKQLYEEWGKFERRELTVEEFRKLFKDMMEFLETTSEKASNIHENLTDVLMAQDFQDITGQIIRRVIDLVTGLEASLVKLLQVAAEAQRMSGWQPPEASTEELMGDEGLDIQTEGPLVRGTTHDEKELARSQDDVDDLLSSLGF